MFGDAMGVGGVTQMATAMSQMQVQRNAQIMVMRKAMDAQSQGAMALISSIGQSSPLPQQAANPPHLGSRIDVRA